MVNNKKKKLHEIKVKCIIINNNKKLRQKINKKNVKKVEKIN